MSNIAGKVVVVTGASSGIGAATAEVLAAQGAKLVLGARRGDRSAALAGRLGANVTYAVTDVRRRADVAALVALAGIRFGQLDVMVNNAASARSRCWTSCAWTTGTI